MWLAHAVPGLVAASFALEALLRRTGVGSLLFGALHLDMTIVWSMVLLAAVYLTLLKLAGDLLSVHSDSRLRRA